MYTSPLFKRLPLADRLSAFPLVTALLEHALDPEAYAAYDRVSAQTLFLGAGISPRLYWCAFLTAAEDVVVSVAALGMEQISENHSHPVRTWAALCMTFPANALRALLSASMSSYPALVHACHPSAPCYLCAFSICSVHAGLYWLHPVSHRGDRRYVTRTVAPVAVQGVPGADAARDAVCTGRPALRGGRAGDAVLLRARPAGNVPGYSGCIGSVLNEI